MNIKYQQTWWNMTYNRTAKVQDFLIFSGKVDANVKLSIYKLSPKVELNSSLAPLQGCDFIPEDSIASCYLLGIGKVPQVLP